jgi:hypothetical protein
MVMETTLNPVQVSTFVEFPDKDEILARLRAIDIYEPLFDPLFELMSERLALKAYDRSAFVFILIELIYEFEEPAERNFNELLSSAVMTLTDDADLVKAALDAFQEIKVTLEPAPPAPSLGLPEPPEDEEERFLDPSIDDTVELQVPVDMTTDDLTGVVAEVRAEARAEAQLREGGGFDPEPVPHHRRRATDDISDEKLMADLQNVQKRIQDLGLSARVLIEITLSRPHGGNVSRAWREVSALRSALRRFESLLSRSEERILEAGGVLEDDG